MVLKEQARAGLAWFVSVIGEMLNQALVVGVCGWRRAVKVA